MTNEPISLRDVAEALSWLEPTGSLLHRHSSQEAACEEWMTRVVGVLRSLEHAIRADERAEERERIASKLENGGYWHSWILHKDDEYLRHGDCKAIAAAIRKEPS
jgi:hypothetical protein